MKHLVLFIFLILFNFLCFNQTRSRSRSVPAANLSETWDIVDLSNNKILSILDDGDTMTKLPKSAIGYPIESYSIDETEYWDYNKNRYLFKYGNQYCIADSNLNIIIDLADSIIPTIFYDTLGLMKIDYWGGSYACLFQVIRNNLTQLVNNDGKIITSIPFEGIINFSFWKLDEALNQKVYITSSLDNYPNRKFGIINFNGEVLIPNKYDVTEYPNYRSNREYYLLINYSEDGRSDSCSVFSIPKKSIVFEGVNMYLEFTEQEVYIFEKDGLLGLYHPALGAVSYTHLTLPTNREV